MINKDRVRRCFLRAADSYDGQGIIQQRVADHLLDLLKQTHYPTINRVLETGCCTGLLTRRLCQQLQDINELVLNDLVEEFALRAGDQPGIPAIRFLAGDIETIALDGLFDLIISSSTLHWVNDLPALLAKLSGHLAPGGVLAFSLYGTDNMKEIRHVTGIGLHYYTLAEVVDMVSRHCTVRQSDEQHHHIHFSTANEVLAHLRQTGVNSLNKTLWTPGRLRRFTREYNNRFSSPKGVQLTYHPMYCIAQR